MLVTKVDTISPRITDATTQYWLEVGVPFDQTPANIQEVSPIPKVIVINITLKMIYTALSLSSIYKLSVGLLSKSQIIGSEMIGNRQTEPMKAV